MKRSGPKRPQLTKHQRCLLILLAVDLLLCIVTKLVYITLYGRPGPLLLVSGILLYYVYQGRGWAVLLYHATTVLLLLVAAIAAMNMIAKIMYPESLIQGHFLAGSCYILFFAVHVVTSVYLIRHRKDR